MKVPENRNYAVRSAARTPVQNAGLRSVPTVRLPNVAGSLEAGDMAPLRAQLGIERDRAAREQARIADKWKRREEALRGLVSVAGNAGKAIYDARDRRDAALLRDAETAYRQYHAENLPAALATTYTPAGDDPNVSPGTSPRAAYKTYHDSYTAPDLPERIRNAWEARRAEIDADVERRVDAAQIDREREWHQGVYTRSIAQQEALVRAQALNLSDESPWMSSVARLATDRAGLALWQQGYAEPTSDDKAAIPGFPGFRWKDGIPDAVKAQLAEAANFAFREEVKAQHMTRLEQFCERINLNDETLDLDAMRAAVAAVASPAEPKPGSGIPSYTDSDRARLRTLLARADAGRARIVRALEASDGETYAAAVVDSLLHPDDQQKAAALAALTADGGEKSLSHLTPQKKEEVDALAIFTTEKRAETAAAAAIHRALAKNPQDAAAITDAINQCVFPTVRAKLEKAYKEYGESGLAAAVAPKAATFSDSELMSRLRFGPPAVEAGSDPGAPVYGVALSPYDKVSYLCDLARQGSITGNQFIKGLDELTRGVEIDPETVFSACGKAGIPVREAYEQDAKGRWGEKDERPGKLRRADLGARATFDKTVPAAPGKTSRRYRFTHEFLVKAYDLCAEYQRLYASGIVKEPLDAWFSREIAKSLEYKDFSSELALQLILNRRARMDSAVQDWRSSWFYRPATAPGAPAIDAAPASDY